MTDIQTHRQHPLDNRIPPPLVLVLVAAAMATGAAMLPPSGLAGPVSWGLTGICLVVAGLFGPPAIGRFRRAGTTINPVAIERASQLVVEGVYGWSRNPMYVSMAAILAAIAAATAQPLLLLGPVAFVLYITRFQIIPEERTMAVLFGEAYAAYRSRVRRWL